MHTVTDNCNQAWQKFFDQKTPKSASLMGHRKTPRNSFFKQEYNAFFGNVISNSGP
jgi:hypothetical protein